MPRSTPPSEAARADRRLAAAVFAAVLLLDLTWRSYYFNFDGVACAIAVELSDFSHLVHGNHLAYGVLAWLFDRLWRAFGWRGEALLTLQVLDAVLGAAGAAAFALLLRRAGARAREAVLGAAALAVSQAWWFWSLEAQVYMLGALFAALAAREALAEEPRPVLVGLFEAGAILGHVGHLTAAPALAWLLAQKRGRAAPASAALACATAVAAAYAAAGLLAVRPHSHDQLRLWLLGSAALGTGRTFLWHGSAPLSALSAWSRMTGRIFCDFDGRRGAAWAAGVLLAALPLAAAVRGARRGGERARFWLLWLAGYAALYLCWEPFTIVYRVSDLLGLWALAAAGLEDLPAAARAAALAAWTLAAGAYNLATVVRPAADPAANADLVDARLAQRAPDDAWVLAAGRGQVYVPYFAHRRPLNPLYLPTRGALFARLDALAAAGEPVYATERALDESGRRAELESYGLSPAGPGLRRLVRGSGASPKAGARRG